MPIRTRQRTKNKIVNDEKWDVVTLGCRLSMCSGRRDIIRRRRFGARQKTAQILSVLVGSQYNWEPVFRNQVYDILPGAGTIRLVFPAVPDAKCMIYMFMTTTGGKDTSPFGQAYYTGTSTNAGSAKNMFRMLWLSCGRRTRSYGSRVYSSGGVVP